MFADLMNKLRLRRERLAEQRSVAPKAIADLTTELRDLA